MKDGNLHEGHRQRMFERFLSAPDTLSEHELLEIFLYSTNKRCDTNPIAHRLINVFGSLKGVLDADAEQLLSVDGVGEKTAVSLTLFRKFIQAYNQEKPTLIGKKIGISFFEAYPELVELFKGCDKEKFVVRLVDCEKRLLSDVDLGGNGIIIDSINEDLVCAIKMTGATGALIAHNHPSGNYKPSDSDDLTTAKCHVLCSVHGINLLDHIIVAPNGGFSYFCSRRLHKIRENINLDNILDKVKGELNE